MSKSDEERQASTPAQRLQASTPGTQTVSPLALVENCSDPKGSDKHNQSANQCLSQGKETDRWMND
jgi:hypothetical protein